MYLYNIHPLSGNLDYYRGQVSPDSPEPHYIITIAGIELLREQEMIKVVSHPDNDRYEGNIPDEWLIG
jgi:hypothetical protein